MEVIKESELLCSMIYRLSAKLPNYEQFGLSSQIRRAIVSVVSNLVEGNSYPMDNGNRKSLFERAYGSIREVQVQLRIMNNVFGINDEETNMKADRIGAMLYSLVSSFRHPPSVIR